MKAQALALAAGRLALSRKAADVVTMDLRGLTTMADFFVVCSADSDVQVRAVADAVEEGMEKKGVNVWHRESGSTTWVLLDFVDVVVHVFHKNTRSFYNLEKLWGDAAIAPVADRPAPRGTRRAAPAPRARKKARA